MTAGAGSGPTRPGVPALALDSRRILAEALSTASYEILPFTKTEEEVLAHVPREVPLTVTTTEAKGLEPTLDLAVRLARHGYRSAPHLAARLVADAAHLRDIVARLDEAGVGGVFVIGGDAAEPAGEFRDALGLLEALEATGHRFPRVGIGGYPEGHGSISAELIEQALERKASHATLVITQICFSSDTTIAWARDIMRRGVELPVRVGIPGPVSRQKLVRISAGLGLGQSARFLSKQSNLVWRFLLPGGYHPDRLITRLAKGIGSPDTAIRGFHVFTFNEIEKTETWRRDWLARLA